MIYVLVPAFDEAATVGLILWKVRQVFTAFNREYQLLVVNDGSTDATDQVLAPYTRALPLTLVSHRQRRGYGTSLEELLRAAVERSDRPRRDMAVTMQADFSDSPDDIPELVKRIEGGADIAVADRRIRCGAPRAERLARRLLPALVRTLARIPGVEDYVGTLRAYRLATVERLVREAGGQPILTRDGWAADLELLVKLSRHARKIESVPVAGTGGARQRPSRAAPLSLAWEVFRAARALRRAMIAPVAAPAAAAARTEAAAPGRAAAPAGAARAANEQQGDRKRQHRRRRGRGGRGGKGRGQGPVRPQAPSPPAA
jgi:glycosyltransferase involved in cell wall biosynthesis